MSPQLWQFLHFSILFFSTGAEPRQTETCRCRKSFLSFIHGCKALAKSSFHQVFISSGSRDCSAMVWSISFAKPCYCLCCFRCFCFALFFYRYQTQVPTRCI